jgi:Uma2 family endonuclease
MTPVRCGWHTVRHAELRPFAEEWHLMAMPVPQPISTIEELLALPDDGLRHELLDGEHVVTPAPEVLHQRGVGEIYVALRQAVGDRSDLEVLMSPADIRLGPRTLVQPDLFIVRHGPGGRFRRWVDAPVPVLAIEVLSPSTARRDRTKKREIYLRAGVEEYWIVDPDARVIERWRRGDERPEIVDGPLAFAFSGASTEPVDLPAVLARAFD